MAQNTTQRLDEHPRRPGWILAVEHLLRRVSQRVRSGGFTALMTAGLGLLAWGFQNNDWFTRTSYDLLYHFQHLPTPTNAVIVYQDELSYDLLNQKLHQPWSRRLHAQLLDRLKAEQAAAVVFDILFDEELDPAEDQVFRQALAANGRAILVGSLETFEHFASPIQKIRPPNQLFLTNAHSWGLGSVPCDDDNTVRGIYPGTEEYPSLAWQAAALVKAPVTQDPQRRWRERWLNYYGKAGTLPKISYAAAIQPDGATPGFFRDKVVFVGAKIVTGLGGDIRDNFRHPLNLGSGEPLPGVEVHATAFLNLLRNEWLRRLPDGWEICLILLWGCGLGYFLVLFRPWSALAVALGAAVGLVGVVVLLQWAAHAWLTWLIPAAVQVPTAFGLALMFHYARVHTEKSLLQQSLAQHLDPGRVHQLLKNPDLRKPGGSHVTISIMFSDIAHFSKISGRVHQDDLIQLLNQYFETSLNIVHRHQGTVIKLLGDAIFAIWNAPISQNDHQQKACAAALQLRDQLADFNTAQGRLPLQTRIGLHTGTAFVGNVGSSIRFDYTAIGENINLASRLEGLNKHLGTDILASRDIQKAVESQVLSRLVGYFRLQGFDRVVEVHELLGPLTLAATTQTWREAFADALHQFHRRNFDAAAAGFNKTLQLRPEDHPSRFYLGKIEEFRSHPPPEEWAGEIELREK